MNVIASGQQPTDVYLNFDGTEQTSYLPTTVSKDSRSVSGVRVTVRSGSTVVYLQGTREDVARVLGQALGSIFPGDAKS